MKILMQNVSANRAEWLKIRSKSVGSSEIAAVVGLSKWKTPLQVWLEKTGRTPGEPENDFMRLGTIMEEFIGEKYARDTGVDVTRANCLLVHPKFEQFTASPDWFEYDELLPPPDLTKTTVVYQDPEGIVECKNVNYRSAQFWEDGACPDEYQIQLQWQLGIAGISRGHIAALVGANAKEFHIREFDYDENILAQLMDSAGAFLDLVKSDTPPPATHVDRWAIERGFSQDPSTRIALPDTSVLDLEAYAAAITKRKEMEAKIKEIKEVEEAARAKIELILLREQAGIGEVSGYRVQVKRVNKASYTTKPSSYILFNAWRGDEKL